MQSGPCISTLVCSEDAKIAVKCNTLNCFINKVEAIKLKMICSSEKTGQGKYLLIMWNNLLKLSTVYGKGFEPNSLNKFSFAEHSLEDKLHICLIPFLQYCTKNNECKNKWLS